MPLRDAPIRRKLMTIMLLTSGLVLLLTCAAFLGYEFLTFRADGGPGAVHARTDRRHQQHGRAGVPEPG